MCGRYSLTHSAEAIAARFGVHQPEGFQPRYNVAPTDRMPVVRAGEGEATREMAVLRWGLVPFWADDLKIGARMINARSETVAEKPAFRAAFRRRRCLVPTDGFYEWVKKGGKKWPIRITYEDESINAFAGLWERWTDSSGAVVQTYTILTTEADPILEDIHGRMPLRAPENLWDAWLFDESDPRGILDEMVRGFASQALAFRPVSPEINRPGNDRAELIEKIDEPGLPVRIP